MSQKRIYTFVFGIALLSITVFFIWKWYYKETYPIEDGCLEKVLPEIIVEATVISLSEPNDVEQRGTLQVDHLYKGPKELFGKTFSVSIRMWSYGGTYGGPMFLLKKGEKGIWSLISSGSTLEVDWRAKGILDLPAREGFSKRYPQIKESVEAVEKLVNTEGIKRLSLLKDFVVSKTPEVSVCAIKILAGLNYKHLADYLNRLLTNKELTIPSQIKIDEVLSQASNGSIWQASEKRKNLLSKWVSVPLDDYESSVARTRIDLIAQHPGSLDYKTILSQVKTAIGNEGISVSERENYLISIRWIYESYEMGDECFDFLVKLVTENENMEIRRQAAYSIRNFIDLNDGRKSVLEDVISHLDVPELSEILEATIKKPENDTSNG